MSSTCIHVCACAHTHTQHTHKESCFSFLFSTPPNWNLKYQQSLKYLKSHQIFSLVFTVRLVHMLHRKLLLSPLPIIWHAFLTDEWKPSLFLGSLSSNLVFRVIKRFSLGSESQRWACLFLLLCGCFHGSAHWHWVLGLNSDKMNQCMYVCMICYNYCVCLSLLPQSHLLWIKLDLHIH